jgi:hypothetical protein
VGLFAKGITWDNQAISTSTCDCAVDLSEDARLPRFGDWSTYDRRDF